MGGLGTYDSFESCGWLARTGSSRGEGRAKNLYLGRGMCPPVPDDGEVIAEGFVRGTPSVSRTWEAAVIDQTLAIPRLEGPCHLSIEIVASTAHSLVDTPAETTLSRRLVRFLDVIEGTLLRADRMDSNSGRVVSITATQRDARDGEPTGVRIIVRRASPDGSARR